MPSPKGVLLKAAELIEETGWGQGNYFDPKTNCYCLMGALYEVDSPVQDEHQAWNEAYDLLLDYMRETHQVGNLVRWNDELDPKTGKEIVVGALRAAAVRDEEEE